MDIETAIVAVGVIHEAIEDKRINADDRADAQEYLRRLQAILTKAQAE